MRIYADVIKILGAPALSQKEWGLLTIYNLLKYKENQIIVEWWYQTAASLKQPWSNLMPRFH